MKEERISVETVLSVKEVRVILSQLYTAGVVGR